MVHSMHEDERLNIGREHKRLIFRLFKEHYSQLWVVQAGSSIDLRQVLRLELKLG